MFRPGGDVVAVVTLKPYSVFGKANVATHGSPHDYDAHVPLLFWGAPFPATTTDRFVRVVDIAPTLGRLLVRSRSTWTDACSRSAAQRP